MSSSSRSVVVVCNCDDGHFFGSLADSLGVGYVCPGLEKAHPAAAAAETDQHIF